MIDHASSEDRRVLEGRMHASPEKFWNLRSSNRRNALELLIQILPPPRYLYQFIIFLRSQQTDLFGSWGRECVRTPLPTGLASVNNSIVIPHYHGNLFTNMTNAVFSAHAVGKFLCMSCFCSQELQVHSVRHPWRAMPDHVFITSHLDSFLCAAAALRQSFSCRLPRVLFILNMTESHHIMPPAFFKMCKIKLYLYRVAHLTE